MCKIHITFKDLVQKENVKYLINEFFNVDYMLK